MAKTKNKPSETNSPDTGHEKAEDTSVNVEPVAEANDEIVSDDDTVQADGSVEELQAKIDELNLALEEARAYALRAHAETDNVRRRMERELEKAHKFGLNDFAQALLSPLDTFDIALKTAKDSGVETQVLQGFELSVKSLADVLAKFGIVSFDPHGEVFDPERHKAMTYVPHADAEPGSVIEVFRKGYLLHDRLLRGAEVVVAKEPDPASE